MRRMNFNVRLSLILIIALLVAAVAVGCGENEAPETTDAVVTDAPAEREILGEGKYYFDFTAISADGERFEYTVRTDAELVSDALTALGLIAGENGPYGLYVKSVCGVVADYDIDKTYWALYVDGEMSMVGVDSLKCADAALVEFKAEK